jgi:hypothetical protein
VSRPTPPEPPRPLPWCLVLLSTIGHLVLAAAGYALPTQAPYLLSSSSKYASLRSLEPQESSLRFPETRIRGREFRDAGAHQASQRLRRDCIRVLGFAYGPKASDALVVSRDPIGFQGGLNLYAYALNSPTNFRDPEGLHVNITFDRSTGQLTAVDSETPLDQQTPLVIPGVTSGFDKMINNPQFEHIPDEGPIPGGTYLIGVPTIRNEDADNFAKYWFPLLGRDGKGSWTYNNIPFKAPSGKGFLRGGFNLHVGSVSEGCVTVPSVIGEGDLFEVKIKNPVTGSWDDGRTEYRKYPHNPAWDQLYKKIENNSKRLRLPKDPNPRWRDLNWRGYLTVK